MTLACLVVCFNLPLLSTLSVCISLLFWIHNGSSFLLSPKVSRNHCDYFRWSYPIWSIIINYDVNTLKGCSKMLQNKIRLHVKYLLNVKSLEIIWSSFLLLVLIKNAIKNAVTVVISLYMVSLENPENQNSEIAANTSESGTWMKLLISICVL